MAIKINTAYKEILTSTMLNEKISGIVGGNEKANGFDVSINTSTSVTITPGRAYVDGCSIEETSDARTITLDKNILSNNGIAYIVLEYIHNTKNVTFSCSTQVNSNMVKLATLVIKNGAIAELVNHESINTLNAVIGASADIEAQKIRDAIPSGFTELGQLDYDFMLNNEHKVKIKGKSTAYVNGYRVEIPANTIINIGKAPEKTVREDLLFLEAWKDSDFTKSGKLKWRIRHVAGVDFDKYTLDGIYKDYDVNWNCVNRTITSQGGNPHPISMNNSTDASAAGMFIPVKYQSGFVLRFPHTNDAGLFVSGNGNVNSKTTLKTLDGYVYAIPMFKLYRKPSCGKSMPFEYSKINPKVDYSKFTKLIEQEKVERVVNESIKGRSLVNKSLYRNYNGGSSEVVRNSTLKANTTYTLSFNVKNKTNEQRYLSVEVASVWVYFMTQIGLKPYEQRKIKKVSVTLTDSQIAHNLLWIVKNSSNVNAPFGDVEITDVMVLEGDWTNKEMPSYFTGLKSLGEDDGNVIITKNGILNDDTYDMHDGNQKLITFPETTHVLSNNILIPKVMANIKKGGESPESLSKLGIKLSTEGIEEIEFTNIKGRTIQNLVTPGIVAGSLSTFYFINKNHEQMLKPNTKYTMILYPSSAKINKVYLKQGVTRTLDLNSKNMALFTTSADPDSVTEFIHFYTKSDATLDETKNTKVVLLEGDYTNVDFEIPYFQGIMSVGENEDNVINITSHGKNLFKVSNLVPGTDCGISFRPTSNNTLILNGTNTKAVDIYFQNSTGNSPILLQKGGTFTIKAFIVNGQSNKPPHLAIATSDINKGNLSWLSDSNGTITLNNLSQDTLLDKIRLHNPSSSSTSYNDCEIMIQVVEGNVTNLVKYTECVQNMYLKEPLRSLPNGVCDEIVGNKLIRRVGTLTLNGSEYWVKDSANYDTDTLATFYANMAIHVPPTSVGISDKFILNNVVSSRTECFGMYTNGVNLKILKSKVPSLTAAELNTWLSNNPVTIHYELATPVEEYLENIYEQESIKTYQLDAPLRSVLGGVADEIKDGVLIRRCGEIRLDGSVLPNKHSVHANGNTHTRFRVPIPGMVSSGTSSAIKNNCVGLCDKLPQLGATPNGGSASSTAEGIYNGAAYYDSTPVCYISVANSKLTDKGIVEWLKVNPIKVIYALAAPIEIPLIEATPQAADFSPQRQCAEGTWLRELPNGVKDTVENGKVIRRVGRKVINGTESWTYRGGAGNPNIVAFSGNGVIPCSTNEHVKNMISDTLPSIRNGSVTTEGVVNGVIDSYAPIVFVDKRRLSSVSEEGFKEWLSKNPMTVLFELKQTTEESLTTNNHMPFPCHSINTCCGNMYVGEGRNYTLNKNRIPSENPVVIETDFRKIEGGARVEDCKYKKCDDGYNTMFKVSKSKNLFDINYIKKALANVSGVMLLDEGIKLDLGINSSVANDVHNILGSFMQKQFKPQTSYIFKIHEYSTDNNSQFSATWQVNYSDGSYAAIKGNVVITPPQKDVVSVRLGWNTQTRGGWTMLNKFQIEENLNGQASAYVPFEPSSRAFENTEENDIEDLRYQVSLTGFNHDKILNESLDKLLKGEL